MKKIVIALLFVIYVASMASAANFVEIYKDDMRLIYIDLDSFQNKGDYVTCWTKWILKGNALERMNEDYHNNVSHFMIFDAYKLKEHQTQSMTAIVYFENGDNKTLYNYPFLSISWTEIIPDSFGEFIWNYVKILTVKH